MKYFAKYLPVEGEIKKEDRQIDSKGNISVFTSVSMNILGETYKKVKLFFCSRDTQVGDKDVHWDEATTDIVDKLDVKLGKEAGAFKVIGEISPEATWVKEGDEFNENEIQRYAKLEHGIAPWIKDREKVGYECIVQIKGPCGHFH